MKHLIIVALSIFSMSAYSVECSDRNALAAALKSSKNAMTGQSIKRPIVLKRHHPSKSKEVATYVKSGDLYYTLYWLVYDDCKAGFIKRTKGKY